MKITIIGLGALGSHVAMLIRNIKAKLQLIDFDKVEQKNIQAQFHTKMALRRNKAMSIQQAFQGMFGIKVQSVPHKLIKDNVNILKNSDIILDCTDNLITRKLIQEFALNNNIPCLHGGFSADGTFGQVMWAEEFSPDPEDKEGQATCEDGENLPFFVLVAAQMAITADRYINKKEKRGFHISPNGIKRVR